MKVEPCWGSMRDLHSTKTSKYVYGSTRESCGKMGFMNACSDDLILGNRDSRGLCWSGISKSSPAAGTGSNISIIIIPEHVQLVPFICFVLWTLCHCWFPAFEEPDYGICAAAIVETMRR